MAVVGGRYPVRASPVRCPVRRVLSLSCALYGVYCAVCTVHEQHVGSGGNWQVSVRARSLPEPEGGALLSYYTARVTPPPDVCTLQGRAAEDL